MARANRPERSNQITNSNLLTNHTKANSKPNDRTQPPNIHTQQRIRETPDRETAFPYPEGEGRKRATIFVHSHQWGVSAHVVINQYLRVSYDPNLITS